ncbi:leukemia inhibitory factor [Rhinatrema bivittatum]|uniref:leukemia inhibitory factor n=1 Tax=Rhinatrema bivittatum TaxID=194408 RepID=UPI00112B9EF0|nr:leukemia inhibitory factor [Rhinatrema bivittatum]
MRQISQFQHETLNLLCYSTSYQQFAYKDKLQTMKFLLAGALHFLFLHHLRLVVSRVLPWTFQSLNCENLGVCGNNTRQQLQSQVRILNDSASILYDTYVSRQGFDKSVDEICRPTGIDFPNFHLNGKDKERMVELYKVFTYMNTSLGNITRDQSDLNPEARDLLALLNNSSAFIRGVISNLTCRLCKKYKVTDVDVSYGSSTRGSKIFQKKKRGCQVLRKYVHVIDKIAQVEVR